MALWRRKTRVSGSERRRGRWGQCARLLLAQLMCRFTRIWMFSGSSQKELRVRSFAPLTFYNRKIPILVVWQDLIGRLPGMDHRFLRYYGDKSVSQSLWRRDSSLSDTGNRCYCDPLTVMCINGSRSILCALRVYFFNKTQVKHQVDAQ